MKRSITIASEYTGLRLDKVLASIISEHSRTTIQGWLDAGRVQLGGHSLTRRYQVKGGEVLDIDIPKSVSDEWVAEKIPIDVVYEDEFILVVNKPVGMVVHPGAGNSDGTLLNALLEHCDSLKTLPRAGIVHRLDKDTSGLLVVAKTEIALLRLNRQFKSRTASREYLGVVEGRLISGGTIDAPIGRHPRHRTKMAVSDGKEAITHYRIVSRFRCHTLVRAQLETGRTHQIRVHFQHMGFPIVGDRDYGRHPKIPPDAADEVISTLRRFQRQALHAESLEIVHPDSQKQCHWHRGIPEDMRNLIRVLKQDKDRNN